MITEPRIDRDIQLRFRADWGQANLTRISGWLQQEIGDRSGPGSEFSIWAGRGGFDQIDALREGRADVALATPSAVAFLGYHGSAELGIAPYPELRALGTIGHDDRLVIAVDAELPVHDAAGLLDIADRLVIATSPHDGVNAIGLAMSRGLALAGAPVEELEARGARFVYDERPFPCLHAFETGEANVVIQEAIMTPSWQRLASQRPVRYLEWGDAVSEGMRPLGFDTKEIRAGYLPGQDEPLRTLDFSNFQLLCRADLPDDIVRLLTWCLVQTRQAIEVQYRSFPADRTPLTYPMDPAAMRLAPLPLHPAAEAVFTELAGQPPLTDGLMWK